MLKLIGTPACARCRNIKRKFESEEIEFGYELIGDLPKDLQEEVIGLAKSAEIKQFPIIVDDSYKAIFEVEEIL